MEKVCPLCNAMVTINYQCLQCGTKMVDGGSLENYFGPYSPYMVGAVAVTKEAQCVHVIYCPNCGYDERIALDFMDV